MAPKGNQAERLRQNEEQLLERRREFDNKDRQIQQRMESFVQDSIVREQLLQELAEARATHQRNSEAQREHLVSEHNAKLQRHAEYLKADARRKLHDHQCFLEDRLVCDAQGELEIQVGCQCEILLEAMVSESEADGGELVGRLPVGTIVVVLEAGENSGWLKVASGDNTEGWISRNTRAGLPVLVPIPDEDNPELEGSPMLQRSSTAQVRMARRLAESEQENQRLLREAEFRAEQAAEFLLAAQAEQRLLGEEVTSEQEAAQIVKVSFQMECRAAQRRGEQIKAEIQSQVSETEGLKDEHRCAEAKVRALQQQMSKTVYTVGQRDQELKVKNSELQEVRQSVTSIQDEMDEVNGRLKEQCGRVHRVETSMRVSRDLGDKVRAMREMVKESHSALGQICGLLETERARREQCTHGLRQQRVRTELLLQLLHHFKSRTQGLAPSSLLAGSGGTTVTGGPPGPTGSLDPSLGSSFT